MIRNTAREIAVHLAYELSFTDKTVEELLDERLTKEYFDTLKDEDDIYEKAPGAAQAEYIRSIVSGVAEHAPELDGYIAKYAKGWSFDRIPLVASAIMRVAMYESLYRSDIPTRVAVNEAVEIAKKYETPETVKFINGILGSFVRGEISNYKLYPSGHHYYTLKDEGSALKCVMFRGMAGKLRFRPENGMKVIAFGRIGVFPRDGAYQLYCSELSVEGVGDLHVAFEQLKEKLFKEGLFDPAHKKPLPKYPKRIAIITSSAGAAVHDMLRILNARWPMSEVVLLPVHVQGAEAPPEIAGALRYANKWQVADLIITGRGGGSIEDLWAFNDERVARAIYASDIPVISAVGHEPDVTIADFVADARASTPSNAAEIAVPDQREIYRRLDALQMRMVQSEQKRVKALREQFEKTSRSRVLQDPMAFIDDKRMLLDYTQKNLAALAQQQMAQRTQQFTALAAKLDALSPLKVLGRGYAVARNEQGQILRAAQEAAAGEKIEVLLGQGSLNCTVNACNMGGNDDGKNV